MTNPGHVQFVRFAEALVFAQGDNAEDEAARQAQLCERTGAKNTALIWRSVQRELRNISLARAA